MRVEPADRPTRFVLGPTRLATALLLLATIGTAQAQIRPDTLAASAVCHGAGGNAPIAQFPSLAGQPRLFIETQLVLIREGLRDIPAMKAAMDGMKDEEIVELAKHFAAQTPIAGVGAGAGAGAAQPQKLRAGADAAAKMLCGTCHLPNFAGQNQVPRLAGQNEEYLVLSMKQFRDKPGPGRDTIMAATLQGASDTELANLAHFLAHFKP